MGINWVNWNIGMFLCIYYKLIEREKERLKMNFYVVLSSYKNDSYVYVLIIIKGNWYMNLF